MMIVVVVVVVAVVGTLPRRYYIQQAAQDPGCQPTKNAQVIKDELPRGDQGEL